MTPLLLAFSLTAGLPGAVPRFEAAPCAAEVATDERIDCGTLVVPENRAKPSSREIRLPVMIFRSTAADPRPDPVVFLTGGPGNSNVAGRKSGKGLPFLAERDYVVLEPRGAKRAAPALECPRTNALTADIAAGRLPGEAATSALASAAGACRADLTARGIDLDGYTTAQAADDLEDLRRLLGYPKWNLLSLSYGTRLALTSLRRHPEGVRSAILDSVLPPDVNFDEVAAANLQRSLDIVFDGCAVDRECSARYPALRQRFTALVASADRRPLDLHLDVEVHGAQVVEAIYSGLHDVKLIPQLPRIISDAADGKVEDLAALVKGNQGPSSFTWGLRYSVWCADEMPFESADRVMAQLSPSLGLGGVSEVSATPAECRAWNVSPSPAVENTPVSSDTPVLVFAGEFDPDTPPAWGRSLLRTMPNARYVEMRGRSHGASFNACGGDITLAFLRDPAAALPLDCAAR